MTSRDPDVRDPILLPTPQRLRREHGGLYRHALHLWAARIRAHGTAVAKRELSSDAEVWPRRSIDAEYAALPAPDRAALAADLAPLVDDFRRLWLTRDRPGGLHDSTGRFERLLAVYRGSGSAGECAPSALDTDLRFGF